VSTFDNFMIGQAASKDEQIRKLLAQRDQLREALTELVRFLEPLERDGLNVPGLATLNRYRALLASLKGVSE
jgi:hypothetical protein